MDLALCSPDSSWPQALYQVPGCTRGRGDFCCVAQHTPMPSTSAFPQEACLFCGWLLAGGAGAAPGGAAGGPAGAADLLRSLQGGGGGMASLLSGMGGGAGPGSGNMAQMTAQLLEDPAMREQMITMMTQPGMIDMIAGSNPQLGQMINSQPMIRQAMQSPDMLRMMLNPDMLRMVTQLQPGLVSWREKKRLLIQLIAVSFPACFLLPEFQSSFPRSEFELDVAVKRTRLATCTGVLVLCCRRVVVLLVLVAPAVTAGRQLLVCPTLPCWHLSLVAWVGLGLALVHQAVVREGRLVAAWRD